MVRGEHVLFKRKVREREAVWVASSTEQSHVNNWSGIWNAYRHIGNFWRPGLIGRTDSYWRGNGEVSGQNLFSLNLRWNRDSRVETDTSHSTKYMGFEIHALVHGLDTSSQRDHSVMLRITRSFLQRKDSRISEAVIPQEIRDSRNLLLCWASLKRAGGCDIRHIFIPCHCTFEWYRQQKCHSLETYSYPDWQFLQITNDIGTAFAWCRGLFLCSAAGMASIVCYTAKIERLQSRRNSKRSLCLARYPSSRKQQKPL